MKKLKEIIQLDEIFDSHYPFEFEKDKENPYITSAKFKVKDKEGNHIDYNVDLFNHKGGDNLHVMFDGDGSFGNTDRVGNKSSKVYGTVKKIIHNHIKENPHIKNIVFTGSKSKSKLYNHIARRIDPNYQVIKKHYTDQFKLKSEINEDFAFIQCQDDSGFWINYSVTINNSQLIIDTMRTIKASFPEKRIRAVDDRGQLIDMLS